MTGRETAEAIEDAALVWVWRLDGKSDDAELQAWLAGDPRRRGAYLKARATWMALDRAQVLPVAEKPRRAIDRRALVAAGIAGLSVASLSAWALLPRAEKLATRTGEIRRAPLTDGSQVVLNTQSRIAVAVTEKRRSVRLDEGEAWFQVAKDRDRPFVVEAGPVRVRAVGTAFSVRRREGGAEVLVTEGVVEAWVEGAEGAARRLSAGESAFVADNAAIEERAVAAGDADRRLAWRDGRIDLRGESLGFAVAEFNRYNPVKLTVTDPHLAAEPLFGVFRVNDPAGFAATAAAGLDAVATTSGDGIALSAR